MGRETLDEMTAQNARLREELGLLAAAAEESGDPTLTRRFADVAMRIATNALNLNDSLCREIAGEPERRVPANKARPRVG